MRRSEQDVQGVQDVQDERGARSAQRPAEDPARQVDDALTGVTEQTGASTGLVFLLPPGERVLRLEVLTGASAEVAAPWTRVGVDDPLPVADAMRERRLLWMGSQEEVARRYPRLGLVVPYDYVLVAAPLIGGGTVWGGLSVLWPASHPPELSPAELDAIHACCRSIGATLARAAEAGRPLIPGAEPRVLGRPRRRHGPVEAAAAAEFLERLPGGCCSLDLNGRITYLTAETAELLGSDVATLMGERPWEAVPALADPEFEDRYREALISREPTTYTTRRSPQERLSFRLYPNSTGISMYVTPSAAGHAPGGAPVRQPPPDAGQHRVMALYHLMHLAATLTEAVGVRDVVDMVGDQIVPAFGPQALALMTAAEGRLHIIGYRHYTAELMSHFDAAPLTSDTPAARVLTTGTPRFYASFEELRRDYAPAVHQDDMAAWAFLPLIASGHVVGSLVLAYDHEHPFSAEERAVLSSLAGLIAQALDRARLYDAKHELARTLQTGLLPHTLPHVPGLACAARYLPASPGMGVGGDFYDLIRCDAATAAAAIGDVQGHNVTAAALMGQVRTAVHAHATAGVAPGDVLSRTNRLLIDLDPGLFTSCLYTQLDLPGRRALVATAGHQPPLLRRPDGRTRPLEMRPGLLLGIDRAAEYPTAEVTFPPGTVLALYTDGLVESPGADLDDAVADLAGRLAAAGEQTVDGLADTLVRHAASGPARRDDIALLLIQATG